MPTDNPILFPPFRLERANEQLWRDETLVSLRPKPFAVLRYLVEHPGRLVTREELQNAIWPGIYVSEGLLRGYIRALREILEDDADAPRFIETVPRRGFRFIAPLSTTSPVASSQYSGVSRGQGSPSQLATDNWQLTTPLVGREAELAQLCEGLAKAARGERQLVFVTGEPGIGKTTLVEAFLQSLESRGRATSVGELQSSPLKC
jgi:DNA-binding winged helix-turn-helix (wHTH) protein